MRGPYNWTEDTDQSKIGSNPHESATFLSGHLPYTNANQGVMDSPDQFVISAIRIAFFAAAGLFCVGSVLPSPNRARLRGLAAVIAVIDIMAAMSYLEKSITAIVIAIAGVAGSSLLFSKRGESEPSSAIVTEKSWVVVGALKNIFFLLICVLLLVYVDREIDRKEPLSSDWAIRMEWMKAAALVSLAGLFGLFAEPIFPGSWDKWSSRFNSTSFIVLGGLTVFALRPTEIEDEIYDCLGFLLILFQIGVGKNLLVAMGRSSKQILAESDAKSVEMTDLKF